MPHNLPHSIERDATIVRPRPTIPQPTGFGDARPDLLPRLSWPSFAAGSVFTLVVFVMARLALGAA